jgi:hypothetical protein
MRLPALVALLLLSAASLVAADFSGKWKGKAVADDGWHPLYIFLHQDGKTLTGSGGPDGVTQDAIQNGSVEGNRLVFDIALGNRAALHFDLTGDGGELKGTAKVRHNGQIVTTAVTLHKATD